MIRTKKQNTGFTLIELLVTLAIIGILISISTFAITQAQQSARNNRRKADLETIRSGLELYRSDCGQYPPSPLGNSLVGSGATPACAATNIYLRAVPADPQSSSGKFYRYERLSTSTYELCAHQESFSTAEEVTCNGNNNCGTANCHYKVQSP